MPELTACSPGRIIWCRLVQKAILADPDLYLESLAVTNIHQDVIDAISEAIDCLRSELHIAAVVMLGRASEGAWIEMGLGLTDSRDIERKLDGLKKLLHDPDNRMRKSYVAS